MSVDLPRPIGLPPGLTTYLNQLVTRLEIEFERMQATQAVPYEVTNGTAARAFDASGTSLADTNNTLATLIQDLQKRGNLR